MVAAWIDGISRQNQTHASIRISSLPIRSFEIQILPFANQLSAAIRALLQCNRITRNEIMKMQAHNWCMVFTVVISRNFIKLSGIKNSNETADNKLTGSSAVLTSSFPHSLRRTNAINDSFHRAHNILSALLRAMNEYSHNYRYRRNCHSFRLRLNCHQAFEKEGHHPFSMKEVVSVVHNGRSNQRQPSTRRNRKNKKMKSNDAARLAFHTSLGRTFLKVCAKRFED